MAKRSNAACDGRAARPRLDRLARPLERPQAAGCSGRRRRRGRGPSARPAVTASCRGRTATGGVGRGRLAGREPRPARRARAPMPAASGRVAAAASPAPLTRVSSRQSQRDGTAGAPSRRSVVISTTSAAPAAWAKSWADRPMRRSGGGRPRPRASAATGTGRSARPAARRPPPARPGSAGRRGPAAPRCAPRMRSARMDRRAPARTVSPSISASTSSAKPARRRPAAGPRSPRSAPRSASAAASPAGPGPEVACIARLRPVASASTASARARGRFGRRGRRRPANGAEACASAACRASSSARAARDVAARRASARPVGPRCASHVRGRAPRSASALQRGQPPRVQAGTSGCLSDGQQGRPGRADRRPRGRPGRSARRPDSRPAARRPRSSPRRPSGVSRARDPAGQRLVGRDQGGGAAGRLQRLAQQQGRDVGGLLLVRARDQGQAVQALGDRVDACRRRPRRAGPRSARSQSAVASAGRSASLISRRRQRPRASPAAPRQGRTAPRSTPARPAGASAPPCGCWSSTSSQASSARLEVEARQHDRPFGAPAITVSSVGGGRRSCRSSRRRSAAPCGGVASQLLGQRAQQPHAPRASRPSGRARPAAPARRSAPASGTSAETLPVLGQLAGDQVDRSARAARPPRSRTLSRKRASASASSSAPAASSARPSAWSFAATRPASSKRRRQGEIAGGRSSARSPGSNGGSPSSRSPSARICGSSTRPRRRPPDEGLGQAARRAAGGDQHHRVGQRLGPAARAPSRPWARSLRNGRCGAMVNQRGAGWSNGAHAAQPRLGERLARPGRRRASRGPSGATPNTRPSRGQRLPDRRSERERPLRPVGDDLPAR